MSDRPDQHTGKDTNRGHLKLVEDSNVEDVAWALLSRSCSKSDYRKAAGEPCLSP